MNYTLLAISIAVTLVYNLARNAFSKKYAHSQSDYQKFNFISSVASALALFIAALVSSAPAPSGYTLLMGVVFGIFTALAALFNMQALERGPMSYTTLIVTSSMIIPALSGWLIFSEGISALKLVGIGLMLISVFLSVFNTDAGQRKASFKWLMLSLASMLFTGLIGVMQKLHQSSPHSSELMYFLITAFAVSALYSAVAGLYYKKSDGVRGLKLPGKTVMLMALLSGVCIAAANLINLYLSGVMESIVFFPTVNGANLILLTLASVVFLHEKLSRFRWIGIIIGFAAIALLCI